MISSTSRSRLRSQRILFSTTTTFIPFAMMLFVVVATSIVRVDGFTINTFRSHRKHLMKHTKFPPSSSSSSTSTIPSSSPPSSTSSCLYLTTLETAGIVGCVTIAGLWIYIESAPNRVLERQRRRENDDSQQLYDQQQEERRRLAYIEPKEYWNENELRQYDGSNDPDGPILLAADGLVFNVWKGRQFYLPGGEYHIFAGRDATRLLARTLVEEETMEDSQKPLSMAERAALAGWIWTFKNKYDIVGKLQDFDPTTTSM